MASNETCLTLQQDQNASWNLVRLDELLAELKAQHPSTLLKP